ncbi:hypothetical protein RJT34_10687 [Clitoria ternatea]|uniref:P-type ATPase A domain-containing protein n=1 Tax=Clitoria ternatea TaxID=43366 RepID=A0AAN9JM51_CLITE
MSQESTSSANANLEHALLCTGNSKYTKQWRKSLYMIGFLNSVRKPPTSTANYESLPQFIPLPTSEPPARTSSAKSSVAIDICSEDEEVKKDVEERIRSDIAGIVMERDLKSLHELGGVELISSVLVDQRQTSQDGAVGGTPTIPAVGTSLCGFLLNSCRCNGYIILMLLVSAALSFATEFKLEGPKHGWHDPVAILLAVFLLVVGNSMASFWRERKMLRLAKKRSQLEFTIERGEESLKVPVSDIVVGDLVCLKPGDEVPAYGLLVSDEILVLAEAKKCKSRNPFLIYGSKVIEGQGKMVVASVGNKTNLVETSACNPERRCLLESLIEKPISYIDKVALFISVLVAFVVFIRLICKKDAKNGGLPEMKGNVSVGSVMEVLERVLLRPQGKVSILTGLVAVAILSVQHGMPLVVAVSLKYKLDKVVSKQDALLNDLSACATMGLVTVICIDVSGGLISKSMEVSKIWIGEEDITSKFEGSETTDQPMLDVLKEGVGLSVLDPDLSFSSVCKPLVYWAEATWEMNMISFRENFDILDHTKLNDKEGSGVLVRKVVGMEVPPDGIVLDGKELQDLNGEAKLDKVGLALVMGSLSPEDKKEMVECLKEKGHVVLKVVLQSYFFLVALSCCFLMQVAVIEYAKGLADCMQLNATEWAICVLISALPWIIEWTICFLIGALPWIIERVLNNFLSTNYASDSELITTSQSFHRSIALPFLMLLLFPVGLIFSQIGMNMTTFR